MPIASHPWFRARASRTPTPRAERPMTRQPPSAARSSSTTLTVRPGGEPASSSTSARSRGCRSASRRSCSGSSSPWWSCGSW